MELSRNGAKAVLRLNTSPKIPADLQAEVRSISAVGEQYVELRPRTNSGPYLHNGSVIAKRDTTIPQAVGPMLDQVSALINSIPKDKLSALLDESFKGFNGAGYDLGSLVDSSSKLSGDLDGVGDQRQRSSKTPGRFSIRRPRPPTPFGCGHGASPASRSGRDKRSTGAHAASARAPRGPRGLSPAQSDQTDTADTIGFVPRCRLRGICLHATDVDRTWGKGVDVRGR